MSLLSFVSLVSARWTVQHRLRGGICRQDAGATSDAGGERRRRRANEPMASSHKLVKKHILVKNEPERT
jgi:hypothetical protein